MCWMNYTRGTPSRLVKHNINLGHAYNMHVFLKYHSLARACRGRATQASLTQLLGVREAYIARPLVRE